MSSIVQDLKRFGHMRGISLKGLSNVDLAGVRDAALPLESRMCAHPDFADEEIAEASTDDLRRYLDLETEEDCEQLKLMHERMLLAKTGRGAWPAGCHPEINPHRHVVKYSVNFGSFPGQYTRQVQDQELRYLASAGVWGPTEKIMDLYAGKRMLDVAFRFKEESFRRMGVKHVLVDNPSEADIRVKSRAMSGYIGVGWFPDGTCRDVVEYHISNSWRASLYQVIFLLAHECGHTNRLYHEFHLEEWHQSVMSYNWARNYLGFHTGDSTWGRPSLNLPQDASTPELRGFYGDEPYPLDEEPEPPTGEPLQLPGTLHAEEFAPNKIAIRGEVKVPKGTYPKDVKLIAYPKAGDPEGGEYVLREPPSV